MVKRLSGCAKGAAAIEYCLLAASLAVALVAVLATLGGETGDSLNAARAGIGTGKDFSDRP